MYDKCIICNSNKWGVFRDSKRLITCNNCSLVKLRKFIIKQDYYRNIKKYKDILIDNKIDARRRNVLDRYKLINNIIKNNNKVLDIGCNEGLFLTLLKSNNIDCIGIEPNKYAYKFAIKNEINVINDYFENVKFNHKFNVITAFHVIEHVNNPVDFVSQINSLLNTDGYLIIETPNINCYRSKKKKDYWEMIKDEHLYYFSSKTLFNLLENNGFIVEKLNLRDFDALYQGMRNQLAKIGIKFYKKIQTKDKSYDNIETKDHNNINHFKLMRLILYYIIKLFKREDYIFVIARKINA